MSVYDNNDCNKNISYIVTILYDYIYDDYEKIMITIMKIIFSFYDAWSREPTHLLSLGMSCTDSHLEGERFACKGIEYLSPEDRPNPVRGCALGAGF